MSGNGIMGRWPIMFWLTAAAVLSLTGCGNDLADVEELVSKFDATVETTKEVEILYSDSAQVKVRVEAPTMLSYSVPTDPRQEFPDKVTVHFFGPGGHIESRLTANYGVRYQNAGLVTVRDSVVWASTKGEKLETEELNWDERQRKIYTSKYAVLTRPGEIVHGYGFEANQDFSFAHIKAVKGRIKVDDVTKELDQ